MQGALCPQDEDGKVWISPETGHAVNLDPWFYHWYQMVRKFGGYFWVHAGLIAPAPGNDLRIVYANIMNQCEGAEIKAGLNPRAMYGVSL